MRQLKISLRHKRKYSWETEPSPGQVDCCTNKILQLNCALLSSMKNFCHNFSLSHGILDNRLLLFFKAWPNFFPPSNTKTTIWKQVISKTNFKSRFSFCFGYHYNSWVCSVSQLSGVWWCPQSNLTQFGQIFNENHHLKSIYHNSIFIKQTKLVLKGKQLGQATRIARACLLSAIPHEREMIAKIHLAKTARPSYSCMTLVLMLGPLGPWILRLLGRSLKFECFRPQHHHIKLQSSFWTLVMLRHMPHWFSWHNRSNEPDFQVENQPWAVYIGRTALVPICQCPSQEMSQLKIFWNRRGGG